MSQEPQHAGFGWTREKIGSGIAYLQLVFGMENKPSFFVRKYLPLHRVAEPELEPALFGSSRAGAVNLQRLQTKLKIAF